MLFSLLLYRLDLISVLLGQTMSTAAHEISHADLVQRLADGNPKKVVIDVRNPNELAAGKLESTVLYNVPLPELKEAFALESAAFKTKYGFDKPQTDDDLVLHCQGGVRSQKAMDQLAEIGYKNLRHYATGYKGFIAYKE